MIEARRNAAFERGFAVYLEWLARRSFDAIWVQDGARLPDGGFVAASNHTSWWDGFVPYLSQRALAPQTPFFVMMSEAELRRFPFFRLSGAFSVDGTSARAAWPSIAYAAQCAASGGGVWIFPEGRIRPPGGMSAFTSGFVHAARRGGVPIVPVALRFAMLGAQRPEAFLTIGSPVDPSSATAQVEVASSVAIQLAEIDEAIREGSTGVMFRPILRGNPGIDRRLSRLLGARAR